MMVVVARARLRERVKALAWRTGSSRHATAPGLNVRFLRTVRSAWGRRANDNEMTRPRQLGAAVQQGGINSFEAQACSAAFRANGYESLPVHVLGNRLSVGKQFALLL